VYGLVAIPRSAPEALVYAIPPEMEVVAKPGVRVRVPMRSKHVTGILVELLSETTLDAAVVKDVEEVLDTEPLLPEHLFQLARFISDYYRCPLGTTFASMLPASLLRSDIETIELTVAGAAADHDVMPDPQREVLQLLAASGRNRLSTLLTRVGVHKRPILDDLALSGLVKIRRRRRDRPPRTEVTALALADTPLEELLEGCSRAPRQRQVLNWLAEQGRPVLASEVQTAVGCSAATIRALAEKGAVRKFSQPAPRAPRWALRGSADRPRLTDEQRHAVEALRVAIASHEYAPFLLDGVTGSGKTEVYLRCLETVLEGGGSGLVLVPEIGLTPAASGAVERRFGSRAAVLHSAQSDGERWREWRRVLAGEARVVVGPRSALFSPLTDLRLIVVDEEHDAAYKQQDVPRYHARDVALVLGKRLAAPVLLCSATPSAEATALVRRGLAHDLRLTRRVAGGTLPDVEVVDLRTEPADPGEQGRTLFSRRLKEAMSQTLEAGDQMILLMQRRGWAPILMCRDCGSKIQCPACSVSMVVHSRSRDLRCHYCGRSGPIPADCPSCEGSLLDAMGAGTEKVAARFGQLFPGVPTAILDRDTVRRRDGLRRSLGAFAAGEVQVLVGTQMVAKGHHFPDVTLTGVISADALLGLPDFRAGERTFQLLTQLAGRAGRGSKPGRVVIQTYYPDHAAVRHACRHDHAAFIEEELVYRRAFSYPPASRMAVVRFESKSLASAREAAQSARRAAEPVPDGIRIRGPAPAPIERLRGAWRWQLVLSAPNRDLLRTVVERVEHETRPRTVRTVVDVDPLSTL
jgi:primosomal protein N' (replication factor Y)